ncbi:MAG: S8 family serine peptidase [SAR324 cluster bacterium]|nr:S8 family serine peptidase [SAR324 cluster bacterium]
MNKWIVLLMITVSFMFQGCDEPTSEFEQVPPGDEANEDSVNADTSQVNANSPFDAIILINQNEETTRKTVVTLQLKAKDTDKIIAYLVSESEDMVSNSSATWEKVDPASREPDIAVEFTLSSAATKGQHSRTVYAWFQDAEKNISQTVSDSIVLDVNDITPPSKPALLINSNDEETTSTLVSVSLSAEDDEELVGYYVSESSTSPASTAKEWSVIPGGKTWAATINFTLSSVNSQGKYNKTVYAWFKDAAGNISSHAKDSISLIVNESTPPSNAAVAINNGASSTNSTDVELKLSATDNVGVVAYYASESGTTPTANAQGWIQLSSFISNTARVKFSLSTSTTPGSYTKTVYVWYKDAAGNVSLTISSNITLVVSDTTAPVSSSFMINNNYAVASTPNVSLTLVASDNVGITGYYASESASTPSATGSGWTAFGPDTNLQLNAGFSLNPANNPGIQTRSVYVWYKDAAGNVSAPASDSILLETADTTSPTSPSLSINNNVSSTTSSSVTLSLSAVDNVGVTQYYVSESSVTPSVNSGGWLTASGSPATFSSTAAFSLSTTTVVGNYTKTVYAWYRDSAGNVSARASDSITLVVSDTTAPDNHSLTINSNDASTTSTAVTLNLAAKDNVGVTAYYASESSSTPSVSASGWQTVSSSTDYSASVSFTLISPVIAGTFTRTVYVWYKDSAGNISSPVNDQISLVISENTPLDALYAQQWHIKNTGQSAYASVNGTSGEDIHMASALNNGYKGTGVNVAVVDTGLEIAHEDLTANIISSGSWDFTDNDTNPTPSTNGGDHGTSVAGLIGARDNALGGRGVAPRVNLAGYNYLKSQSTSNWVAALGGTSSNPNSATMAIFNQSYGNSTAYDFQPSSTIEAQYINGITNLRGGKGALYVKSAGNGFNQLGSMNCSSGLPCQNANMDAYNALPWQIVVGAVNADGKKSSYSTPGSALWVSAPGGEYGYASSGCVSDACKAAMVTTDLSGCDSGYATTGASANPFEGNTNGLNTNCNYTSVFNGTSSAAPVTSGAIALILQANTNLTWRDVKHILASTSDKVDSSHAGKLITLGETSYQAELPWITNAAGYHFHNWYGFGRVNVDAAISMATSYSVNLGTRVACNWRSSGTLEQAIPDGSATGASHTINVTDNLTIEAVQIRVSVTHPYTGDLGIELVSPSGTKSILLNILNGFANDTNLSDMLLLSNAFYGEGSSGNWTVKIIDGSATDSGTLTNWQIHIHGRNGSCGA